MISDYFLYADWNGKLKLEINIFYASIYYFYQLACFLLTREINLQD